MPAFNEQEVKIPRMEVYCLFLSRRFDSLEAGARRLLWWIATSTKRPGGLGRTIGVARRLDRRDNQSGALAFLRRFYCKRLPLVLLPHLRTIALILLLQIVFGIPVSAKAQDARLKNITIATTDKFLAVSLNVDGAFSPKIMDSLKQGDPVSFSFYIILYQNENLWFDKKLVARRLVNTIMYDPQKKRFTISRLWRQKETIVTTSWDEAQELMTRVEDFNVFALNDLHKGTLYDLRAKAVLHPVTLPYNLRYIFYFVSLWDIETDWHTVVFEY